MKIAKIKKANSEVFMEDLKKTTRVMVLAEKTSSFFTITKKDLLLTAETKKIDYFMSENLDNQGFTMVVR